MTMGDTALRFSGSVGLDLSLSLGLMSRFPREVLDKTKEIPKEVLELLTDAEGEWSVCRC